jgi:hypothetical protein
MPPHHGHDPKSGETHGGVRRWFSPILPNCNNKKNEEHQLQLTKENRANKSRLKAQIMSFAPFRLKSFTLKHTGFENSMMPWKVIMLKLMNASSKV